MSNQVYEIQKRVFDKAVIDYICPCYKFTF